MPKMDNCSSSAHAFLYIYDIFVVFYFNSLRIHLYVNSTAIHLYDEKVTEDFHVA